MGSALTGLVNSLLSKLSNLLQKEYKLLQGVENEITSLKDEVMSINAALEELGEAEQLNALHRVWWGKISDLARDIDDCIDIFTCVDDRGRHTGFIWKAHHGLNTMRKRYRVAKMIEELKMRSIEVSTRHKSYDCSVSKDKVVIDPRLNMLNDNRAGFVGIDNYRENIIGLLEGTQERKFVSIVGFGGIGKTTVANQVYTEIKSQFECSAFVSISQKPKIQTILEEILCMVGSTTTRTSSNVQGPIRQLKEHLKNKRYLIVIDDIWTIEHWATIRNAFVENGRGSRVITTIRIESVAKACSYACPEQNNACSCPNQHIYKIKPLNDLNSRRLFHRRVFGQDPCPGELSEVSDKVLKKCEGVPLTIITVASLLACGDVESMENWEKIHNSLVFQLEPNNELKGLTYVLNLSYSDLSVKPELKSCLLYLAIFPEDSIIMKDDLIRRWIAEGLVREEHGRDQEERAENLFNELVNRNMIQPANFDVHGDVKSFRVNDIVLDFIIWKSSQDSCGSVTVTDAQQCPRGSPGSRRLFLHTNHVECQAALMGLVRTGSSTCEERDRLLSGMDLHRLRSFTYRGLFECMPSSFLQHSVPKFQLLFERLQISVFASSRYRTFQPYQGP